MPKDLKKLKIPLINKAVSWKTLIYLTILGLIIYFIFHEKSDFPKIQHELGSAKQLWIFIGLAVTLLYVFFQALMYYYSFKTLNKTVTLSSCIMLYLNRNFLSVFLPAGGFSSLVFFNKQIETQNISKTKMIILLLLLI